MRKICLVASLLIVGTASLSQTRSSEKRQGLYSNPVELTAKDTIDAEPLLTAPDKKLLKHAIGKQLAAEYQKDVALTRIKVLDLNNDGVSEVIAQGIGEFCSPTGNCPIWVFKKTASDYKVILTRGAVQTFSIEGKRHSGYLDIVLRMHGSATEQDLRLYQFKNGQYRNSACYNASWSYTDKNGEEHDLRNPRITTCVGYR